MADTTANTFVRVAEQIERLERAYSDLEKTCADVNRWGTETKQQLQKCLGETAALEQRLAGDVESVKDFAETLTKTLQAEMHGKAEELRAQVLELFRNETAALQTEVTKARKQLDTCVAETCALHDRVTADVESLKTDAHTLQHALQASIDEKSHELREQVMKVVENARVAIQGECTNVQQQLKKCRKETDALHERVVADVESLKTFRQTLLDTLQAGMQNKAEELEAEMRELFTSESSALRADGTIRYQEFERQQLTFQQRLKRERRLNRFWFYVLIILLIGNACLGVWHAGGVTRLVNTLLGVGK